MKFKRETFAEKAAGIHRRLSAAMTRLRELEPDALMLADWKGNRSFGIELERLKAGVPGVLERLGGAADGSEHFDRPEQRERLREWEQLTRDAESIAPDILKELRKAGIRH